MRGPARRDARCCVDRGDSRRARGRRAATTTIALDLDSRAVRVRPWRSALDAEKRVDVEDSARGRRAWTLRGDEGGRGARGWTANGRRARRERANDGTRTRYRGFLAKMESTKMDAEALRERLVAVREKTQEAMKKIEVPKVEDLRMLIEDIRQEQTEAKYHPDRRRLESVADFFAYTEEEGESRNRSESKRARGDATLTLPMTD